MGISSTQMSGKALIKNWKMAYPDPVEDIKLQPLTVELYKLFWQKWNLTKYCTINQFILPAYKNTDSSIKMRILIALPTTSDHQLYSLSATRNDRGASIRGVGIAIQSKLLPLLLPVKKIDERIVSATFKGNPKTTIISS